MSRAPGPTVRRRGPFERGLVAALIVSFQLGGLRGTPGTALCLHTSPTDPAPAAPASSNHLHHHQPATPDAPSDHNHHHTCPCPGLCASGLALAASSPRIERAGSVTIVW